MNLEEKENMPEMGAQTAAPEQTAVSGQTGAPERVSASGRTGAPERASGQTEVSGQAAAQTAAMEQTAAADQAAQQEQQAKKPQNRRPAQRKSASKEQGTRAAEPAAKEASASGRGQGQKGSRGGKGAQASRPAKQAAQAKQQAADGSGQASAKTSQTGLKTAQASSKASQQAKTEKASQQDKAAKASQQDNRSGQGTAKASRPQARTAAAKASSASKELKAPVRQPSRDSKKDGKGKLKIIPLGGLEQIGMNITAFEYEDSIIIVDCGLAFPGDDMLGIDLVIPDVSYLKQNIDKVKGFVITHGHEDHIGALPYILQQINVPVYGTKLTIALIEHKLEEHRLMKNTKRKVVKHGQSVNLGCFRVEFIKTNHSIQDASALAIFSPVGIVLHTGDFKIDYTPVFGDPIDLQRFAELGKKGVLALLADSTNATRTGFTMSQFEYASLAKISALVASKSLDVFIGDQEAVDHYGTVNAFQDLEAYLPPEIYSLAEDSIYSTEDEQGILKPVALSLEGTSFAGQTGIVMNPPYLAVMSTSQHKEEVLQMIEYLFR